MRAIRLAAIVGASFVSRDACVAQRQPATIPTVVAQAVLVSFGGGMFGTPTYTVGTQPPGWPKDLIPSRGEIIGGGTVGFMDALQMRTLVVAMPAGTNSNDAISAMAAKAGYAARTPRENPSQGGFLGSPGMQDHLPLCKGTSSLFAFAVVDSLPSSPVFALSYVDGDAARENCKAADLSRSSMRGDLSGFGPKHMPGLIAPSGVAETPGGMSWSGSSGSITTALRTTMASDSILQHYSRQLVSAGWALDGSTLANRAIGVQKFRFKDGEDAWSALMIVEAVGNRRDVTLRLAMVNPDP